MLRIPGAGDSPPPLLIPLPTVAELRLAELPPPRGSRRRSKKARIAEGAEWDLATRQSGRTRRGERRQMFWMLIGGGVLFALLLAGVLVTLLGGDAPPPPVTGAVTAQADSKVHPPQPVVAPVRSDAAWLAAAEPLARTFLDARSIEEMLPVLRNPALAEPRLRRFYPEGKIDAPGMVNVMEEVEVVHTGSIITLKVRTRSYEEKSISLVDTPQGLKIDWESWVGWSDMPWEEFLASKPTTSRVFRVLMSSVDYYNFAFADDVKWQAYRLSSPDESHAIYGYAERGSKVNASLLIPPESTRVPLTLALKFPEHATSNNQVLIEKLVADGWVLESTPAP